MVLVASKKSRQCSFLLTTGTEGPEDHLTVPAEAGHCLSSEALLRESSTQKGVLGIVATKLVAIRYLIPRPRWRIVVLVASKKLCQDSVLLTTRAKRS